MNGNTRIQPSPGLFALLFAVFVTVLGVGMAVPLLPLYAHRLGGDGLHIGMLSAAFALSRLVFAPWFARHSDSHGRKAWIVSGLALYAAISAALGRIHDLDTLVAARALHGIAAAMLAPLMQAYAGDLAPRGREGKLMGMYGTTVLAGLGIGPLVGGVVNDHLGSGAAFLLMGALAALGAAACALRLPPVREEAHVRAAESPARWEILLRDRVIAGLIVFRYTHVVCVGIVWAFLPLYVTTTSPLSSAVAGLVVGLGVLSSGLVNLPMGALADRVDRRRLVVAGGVIGAWGIFSLGGADGLGEFVIASTCLGVGGGIATPAVMAIVTRHGQRNAAMGSMMALMTTVHGAGMMSGALLGGLIMDRFALAGAFPAGAALLLGGTLAFVLCTTAVRPRRSDVPVSPLLFPLR
jgi:MFS family permease